MLKLHSWIAAKCSVKHVRVCVRERFHHAMIHGASWPQTAQAVNLDPNSTRAQTFARLQHDTLGPPT